MSFPNPIDFIEEIVQGPGNLNDIIRGKADPAFPERGARLSTGKIDFLFNLDAADELDAEAIEEIGRIVLTLAEARQMVQDAARAFLRLVNAPGLIQDNTLKIEALYPYLIPHEQDPTHPDRQFVPTLADRYPNLVRTE